MTSTGKQQSETQAVPITRAMLRGATNRKYFERGEGYSEADLVKSVKQKDGKLYASVLVRGFEPFEASLDCQMKAQQVHDLGDTRPRKLLCLSYFRKTECLVVLEAVLPLQGDMDGMLALLTIAQSGVCYRLEVVLPVGWPGEWRNDKRPSFGVRMRESGEDGYVPNS